MIPESEISECSERKVKSNTGKIFVNEKILEEYFVKIYEINPYFFEHYKEKMQANKNGCEYIIFRIDVYFIEYLLAAEIDEKVHTDKGLIFEKKGKQLQKKTLLYIYQNYTSKEDYNADYEVSRIQTLNLIVSKFKYRQLKKLNKKLKELEDEIKKINKLNHSIKSKYCQITKYEERTIKRTR